MNTTLDSKNESLFCEMMRLENEKNFLIEKNLSGKGDSVQFVQSPKNRDKHWYQYLVEVLLVKIVGYNTDSYARFIQLTVVDSYIHPVQYLHYFFTQNGKKFIV